MSWNGSNLGGAEAPKVEAVKKAPSMGKGLLAGLIVIVLAAVAVWFFVLNKDVDEPKEEQAPSKTIAEVKPRTQPLPTVTRESLKKMVKDKTGSDVVLAPWGYYTNKQGKVVARTRPPFIIGGKSNRPKIFASPAEDQLDGIVNTPLGENYYDDRLPENFEDEFAYSLTNKIEILETDTPEIADRKQRVIEAKETLIQAQKEGRNIREVMLEAKKDMVKKFEDYVFYESGLNQLRASNASPEEIAEYALAAKTMMEKNGLEAAIREARKKGLVNLV